MLKDYWAVQHNYASICRLITPSEIHCQWMYCRKAVINVYTTDLGPGDFYVQPLYTQVSIFVECNQEKILHCSSRYNNRTVIQLPRHSISVRTLQADLSVNLNVCILASKNVVSNQCTVGWPSEYTGCNISQPTTQLSPPSTPVKSLTIANKRQRGWRYKSMHVASHTEVFDVSGSLWSWVQNDLMFSWRSNTSSWMLWCHTSHFLFCVCALLLCLPENQLCVELGQ